MYKLGWEGHLLQYTEAKTVEVPLARDGMIYKEFPVSLDWFHHGESLAVFNLQGLSDPYDISFQHRARRYAGLYMDEDPQARNYDPAAQDHPQSVYRKPGALAPEGDGAGLGGRPN